MGMFSSSTKVELARSPDLMARLAAVRCSAVQAGIRLRRSYAARGEGEVSGAEERVASGTAYRSSKPPA